MTTGVWCLVCFIVVVLSHLARDCRSMVVRRQRQKAHRRMRIKRHIYAHGHNGMLRIDRYTGETKWIPIKASYADLYYQELADRLFSR